MHLVLSTSAPGVGETANTRRAIHAVRVARGESSGFQQWKAALVWSVRRVDAQQGRQTGP